jgi:hypothetical protein
MVGETLDRYRIESKLGEGGRRRPFSGTLQLLSLTSGVTSKGEPRAVTLNAPASYGPKSLPDSTEIVFSAKGALWRLGIGEGETPERLPFVGEDGIMPVVSRAQRDAQLGWPTFGGSQTSTSGVWTPADLAFRRPRRRSSLSPPRDATRFRHFP